MPDKFNKIEQEMILLQESMNILHELVHSQQESIDTLEEYIEESKKNTSHALEDISTYSWYDYTKYIVGGIILISINLITNY